MMCLLTKRVFHTMRPQALHYESGNFTPQFFTDDLRATCSHCTGETPSMCCNNGKVDLQPLPGLPPSLSELFAGSSMIQITF
ncbi:hypothetical protein RRG08_006550 [Elysia crispata]|uniref:Uncharacterized protein n=1 Tax=Elysia crispata TaxID=231223 RepID=A0AAE1ATZ1_9GAST|nr:hypothetical protein RRG08_006550 [Elysia crispata]